MAKEGYRYANDSVVILLELHNNFLTLLGNNYLTLVIIGMAIAFGGSAAGLMKTETLQTYLITIMTTFIFLYPLSVSKDDLVTSMGDTASRYSSNTYNAALGPWAINKGMSLTYQMLSSVINGAVYEDDGDQRFAGGAMDALQAISLSNSSIGYLIDRTPLYGALIAYNSYCSNAANYYDDVARNAARNGSSAQPIEFGQWLGAGLFGGAHFIGRDSFERIITPKYDLFKGGMGTVNVEPPNRQVLNALANFPERPFDLSKSGIMVLNRDYWLEVGLVWQETIDQNPNLTYQGLIDLDPLQGFKSTGPDILRTGAASDGDTSSAVGFYSSMDTQYAVKNSRPRYAPHNLNQSQINAESVTGEPYNRFWPGTCEEYYEIVRMAYDEFHEGMKGLMAINPDTGNGPSWAGQGLRSQTIEGALQSSLMNVTMAPRSKLDTSNSLNRLDATTDEPGFMDKAKNFVTGAGVIGVQVESFFKGLSNILNGPILISTIATGLGLLFAISPIWFGLQFVFPGMEPVIQSYIKLVGMLYILMLFLFLGTTVSDYLSGVVLQSYTMNEQNIEAVIVPGEGANRDISCNRSQTSCSEDPVLAQRNSINALSVQIIGLHFLNLAILALASYASYLVIKGADRGLQKINPQISHGEKIVAGAGLLGAKMLGGAITGGIASMLKGAKAPENPLAGNGGPIAPTQWATGLPSPSSGGGGGALVVRDGLVPPGGGGGPMKEINPLDTRSRL